MKLASLIKVIVNEILYKTYLKYNITCKILIYSNNSYRYEMYVI